MKTNEFPFDSQQNQLIEKLFDSLDVSKLYWLHGYIQALIQARQENSSRNDNGQMVMPLKPYHAGDTSTKKPLITVLFGTQTGNSRKIASQLFQQLERMGHSVRLADMADFKNKDLKSEKFLLVIISTQGEGQPPLAAEEFYEFIHSKHSPALPDLSFAVLALGDKSYFNFCKTGADIDLRLEQLGAKRLIPRYECDLDFIKPAEQWINDVIQALAPWTAGIPLAIKSDEIQLPDSLPTREKPIEAIVVNKIKLNGRGSEKNTYHLELQLPSEQMIYQPGDSVGIIPCNNHELVSEMIHLLKANPEMPVVFQDSSGSLGSILANEVELTKLTRENLEKYNQTFRKSGTEKISPRI